MVAINIRGTGGSGKSYLVHKLLKAHKHKRIVRKFGNRFKPKIVAYYIPEFHLYVIGSYDSQCGGCDKMQMIQKNLQAIKGLADVPSVQDLTVKTIERYAKKGNVLYEGLLISGIWGRYKELHDRLSNSIWIFLDTPLSVCLERTNKRRRLKGKTDPVNPKATTSKHRSCIRQQPMCKAAGMRYEVLNYKKAYKQLLDIIKREMV